MTWVKAVAAAEAKIGHKLPEAYLALLREQNGGYIRYTLPESVHSLIYGIGPHFPSLTGFDWEEVRGEVSFELDGLVCADMAIEAAADPLPGGPGRIGLIRWRERAGRKACLAGDIFLVPVRTE